MDDIYKYSEDRPDFEDYSQQNNEFIKELNNILGMKTAEQILDTKRPNSEYPSYYHESDIIDAMEAYADQFKPKVIEITDGQKPILINMGWISVKDRLPNKACHVLVYGSYTRDCPRRSQESIFYPKGKIDEFRNMNMSRTKNVTHWMPLPEPPTI